MISGPIVTVYCDTKDCGYSEEFGLTPTARRGYDERNLEGEMRNAGWVTLSENVHRCPDCTEKAEEESA